MSHIGERIREIRKARGKTQKDLALKLGTTQRTISQYETGKTIPDAKVIGNLIRILEVEDPKWLIIGDELEVKERREPYFEKQNNTPRKISSLLAEAAEILESDSIYRQALAANIGAFYHAIQSEKASRSLRDRIAYLENEDKVKEARITALERLIDTHDRTPIPSPG